MPAAPIVSTSLLPGLEALPIAEAGCVAAAFVCGATLGSFINVVAHRVPLGESVAHGRSRCPQCGAGIRPRDNVPVLGWILLGGRCRDCAAPISPRYPLVEAACGAIAAVVAAAELAAGVRGSAVDRILLHGEWPLLAGCVVHVVALLCILTWTLPEMRGAAAVCRGASAAIAGMLLLAWALPSIGPAGMLPDGAAWPAAPRAVQSLCSAVVGAASGAAIGAVLGHHADRCGLALLGAAAGWQAVMVAGIVTAILRTAGVALGRPLAPALAAAGDLALVPATVMAMLCWRPMLAALPPGAW